MATENEMMAVPARFRDEFVQTKGTSGSIARMTERLVED